MDSTPLAFIVEDNEDQNWVFTTALEQAGYRTESIRDGSAAQKRLEETAPSLIVLDLHIPGVSGEKLLGQVRGESSLAKTFVILATADALKAEELQAQADLVLLKPISYTQLSVLASRYRGVVGD